MSFSVLQFKLETPSFRVVFRLGRRKAFPMETEQHFLNVIDHGEN